ncbi:MAG: hypothetical protein E7607_05385 [Ruminococcaceae bacterium]|nr:hypothetical protein [Oscillospiraceae bacterium]
MTISEKAAYIKGLADGTEIDNTTKEGKLILALIDIVGEMAEAIADLEADVDTAFDYCEELDEDLGAVEELLIEDDECDCCDCDDCDCDCDDCDCDCCDDEEYFEVECPSCGETICFDGSIDPEELACPACGEKFECIIAEDDLADAEATEEAAE